MKKPEVYVINIASQIVPQLLQHTSLQPLVLILQTQYIILDQGNHTYTVLPLCMSKSLKLWILQTNSN